MNATENVQRVKKSCYQYLSKYLSKGVQLLQSHQTDPEELASICPSTWWHMTATLRQRVKRSVRYGKSVGEALQKLLESSGEKLVAWSKDIRIELSDGKAITVGTAGGLTRLGQSEAQLLIQLI